MLVRVVGLLRQDFRLDNGFEFHGYKFQCLDESTQNKDLQGKMVLDFKVPDGHPLSDMPVHLGKVYKVYFDQKGRLDFMTLDDGAAAPPSSASFMGDPFEGIDAGSKPKAK